MLWLRVHPNLILLSYSSLYPCRTGARALPAAGGCRKRLLAAHPEGDGLVQALWRPLRWHIQGIIPLFHEQQEYVRFYSPHAWCPFALVQVLRLIYQVPGWSGALTVPISEEGCLTTNIRVGWQVPDVVRPSPRWSRRSLRRQRFKASSQAWPLRPPPFLISEARPSHSITSAVTQTCGVLRFQTLCFPFLYAGRK